MLLNFNNVVPEIFNMTKLRMETALAQYFHKDGTIALFNGTSNYDLEKIKSVLIRKQNIRKLQFPDDYNGVYYFEDKNKNFIDAIQPNSDFIQKHLVPEHYRLNLVLIRKKLSQIVVLLKKIQEMPPISDILRHILL